MKTLSQLVQNNARMQGWKVYLDYYSLDQRSRRLSPATIRTNDGRLQLLAQWLDSQGINIEDVIQRHIQEYVLHCFATVSDETTAGRIRTLKTFWRILTDGQLWTKPNPMEGIHKPKVTQNNRTIIKPSEFEAVLSVCNRRTFLGNRNYTMLLMLYDCMLRRAEIAKLEIADIDMQASLMRIKGKGNKVRYVPVGVKLTKALHLYLHRYRSKYPGTFVFCNRQGQPLAFNHVRQICFRTAKKVGIHMGAHIVRHSAATEYLRRGGQIGMLSMILGHSSLAVTSVYTHLVPDDLVKSYEQFSPANSLSM